MAIPLSGALKDNVATDLPIAVIAGRRPHALAVYLNGYFCKMPQDLCIGMKDVDKTLLSSAVFIFFSPSHTRRIIFRIC